MKTKIYLPAVILLACFMSACTSYNYYTAAINKTDLSGYHTFAWMPQANKGEKAMTNEQADAKIKDAVTQDLVAKGFQLSQANPDLIVNYSTKVGKGTRTNFYGGYYGGYPGWGFGWGWGWAYRPYYYAFGAPFSYYGPVYAEKEHYKEGTLIIDLVDSKTHKIMWRGFGVGEMHKNPEKNMNDLPRVIDGVLSQIRFQSYAQGPVRRG